jgi:superfamily II DNA or RNA helicase
LDFVGQSDDSTMIIMPTGSGKTRLMWSHKKAGLCSVIFAPFKILIEQLTKILKEQGIVYTAPFSSDSSSLAMVTTADFIIMPYEAAQKSQDLLSSLHKYGRLGPIWIDEVRYTLYCGMSESHTYL